jgi:ribose-phosphate pyrophosphokinase
VSPDVGGVGRARGIAKRLDAQLAIVDKRRERAGVSEVVNVIGGVSDRLCVLVDDIVDSGGTLCNAAQALLDAGATAVVAYVTHGVLSAGAVAALPQAPRALVITNSIRAMGRRVTDKIRRSVAPLIGGRSAHQRREFGVEPVRLRSGAAPVMLRKREWRN